MVVDIVLNIMAVLMIRIPPKKDCLLCPSLIAYIDGIRSTIFLMCRLSLTIYSERAIGMELFSKLA